MIKCINVRQKVSYEPVGYVLQKELNNLQDSGNKVISVWETTTFKVPDLSAQGFIILYDDMQKESEDKDE